VLRKLLLHLSTKLAIGRTLDRFPASRRVVRRFVAGERIEDALPVLARLNDDGFESAVTYLGENVSTPKAARAATDTYCALLDAIHRLGLRTNPSLKLTHLGLDLGEEVVWENVERVMDRAGGTVVWLDMEGSAYTDRTLAFYRRARARWPNVACVVQAYLYRTEADVKSLVLWEGGPGHPLRVRLCKGAYREPPAVAYPVKADVDRNYARLAGLLLSPAAQRAGAYPGFATHDERLIRVLLDKTRELGLPPDRFEFQMLHGIRPDLHAMLKAAGVRLRVLVPFGEDWYGYFVRRLAERPANLLFLARNLGRG
jgi:proline dehydrogenase